MLKKINMDRTIVLYFCHSQGSLGSNSKASLNKGEIYRTTII
uniref:Uncharacterized protein n=1 Tax=Arundo donax TaxID=35708 RepID=A0A0A9UGS9_ARUDO